MSASVDVELRKDMWEVVKRLKQEGVTIILTTHYIEEAEEIADRVGIINNGKIILVDEKENLIKKLGQKILKIELGEPINEIPSNLIHFNLAAPHVRWSSLERIRRAVPQTIIIGQSRTVLDPRRCLNGGLFSLGLHSPWSSSGVGWLAKGRRCHWPRSAA